MAAHRTSKRSYFAIRRAISLAKSSKFHQNCDALVRELAEGTASSMRQQLKASSAHWDASQLRGYVRARAAGTVRSMVQALVTEGRLAQTLADVMAARTVERTAHLVVRDIMKRPMIRDSALSAERRAA